MESDIASWGLFAFIAVAFIFIGVRMVRSRMDHIRAQEELAEMEFQQTVLASFGQETTLGDDDRFASKADVVEASLTTDRGGSVAGSENGDSALTSPVQQTPAPANPLLSGEPLPADVAAVAVMNQLGAMGLVNGVDGYVALHNNPKGAALLRLRTGKQALLVPHMESEAFLRHNARRVDFIIMTGTDGKAFVVSPLEQFLAESFPAR